MSVVLCSLAVLLAPCRETIDLGGTWQKTEVRRSVAKVDGGQGVKLSVMTETPLPANAVWKPVTVPVNEGYVSEDRLICYRRAFELAPEALDRIVAIVFEKPFDRIRVKVNGIAVGDARPWGLAWECDATKAVKVGTNEIEVCLSNERDVTGPQHGMIRAPWEMACFGMRRGVRVELRPKTYVKSVRAVTRVFPEKELAVSVCVTNMLRVAYKGVVRGEVEKVGGGGQWMSSSSVVLEPGEGKVVELKKPWPDAHLWTPDDPYLYNLKVELHCPPPPSTSTCVDALCQRIGFRELDWSGRQLKLNGHPFMHRRVSWGNGDCDDPEKLRAKIRLLKRRGVIGARVFVPQDVELIARIADEEGFLMATCAPVGNCADYKTDAFWEKLMPDYLRAQIDQQGSHPSIICWGLGNEFGSPYAGVEKTNVKQIAVGEKVQAMDPTRPWCYYGEIEKGVPVRGPGPQPIRSVHYPSNPSGGLMPHASQWLNEHGASWHGVWTGDKPVVVSEDLYHGMNDQFVGLSKWGGDSVYTAAGCFRTCFQAYRWFALGYYRAGLSGWEPWATFVADERNPLYDANGQVMPDFLFAPRDWHRNFFAGERKTVVFDLFNQTFTPYDGEIVFTTLLDGKMEKTWRQKVVVPQGEGRPLELMLDVPSVEKPRTWTLVAELPSKMRETVDFYVFPRVTVKLPADVVTNKLTVAAGRALAKEVSEGRRVLLLDVPKDGWAPFEIARKTSVNFLFKRDGRHLKDIPEGALASWRLPGAGTVCVAASAYHKPSGLDAEIWLDSADADGLRFANVMRLSSCKGFWILCQLPLLERLACEPAAGWILKSLIEELEKGADDFPKKSVAASGAAADLFRSYGVATDPDGAVICANALTPQILASVKDGGKTLWLSEPTSAFPADWPIRFVAQTNKEWICRYANRLPGPDAPFVSLTRRIPGLSNDDLFWWQPGQMWTYFQRTEIGGNPHWIYSFALTGAIEVKDGATGVRLFTAPTDAMAAFRYGKGLVFVSTLKLSFYSGRQPVKVERTIRRILNCLGAKSDDATALLPKTWHPDVFTSCNAILYHAQEKDPAKVWFGTGDDMRYFPVNQCGWSVIANNKCPVEPWPKDACRFQGVPFVLRNPGKPDEKAYPNIVRIDPGAKRQFWAEFCMHPAYARRIWFLGACEKPPTKGALAVEVAYTTGPNRLKRERSVFEYGRHFGAYGKVEKLTAGHVAWQGPTKDLRTAALYLWNFEVPEEHLMRRIGPVELENAMDVPVVLLGITEEN